MNQKQTSVIYADQESPHESDPRPLMPPVPPQHVYPDFAQIDRDLGFREPGESRDTKEHDEERISGAALMLGDILTFCTDAPTMRAIGARALGVALCLRPALFHQRPARETARQLGVSEAVLSEYLKSVHQRFNLLPGAP